MDFKSILLILFLAIISSFSFFISTEHTNEPIKYEAVKYEIVKYNFKSFEPNLQIMEKENNFWISICLGEKKSGGYEVKVNSIKRENDKLIIEISSKQNSKYVTQEFSYPSLTISIPKLDIKVVEVYIYEDKIPLIITKDIE
ncbi:protease complex subunit PrcB family protein [Marinitoga sp. 38H-ov]|uniref:protease complex subunit PrcB family protein n=1 Tax=Marinitoga sp. 38H-ov TaxID=1755814 RepID=UPI0013ECBA31|nr:protease complex subunit PrcB family protein [Marinitoga sp. 38H-ov]KAF2956123.1 hypothetical protein AS160_07075 [Marinitoga sp. 38H-ov]